MSCESQGLNQCLGYLRQLHCVIPFIYHSQGCFAFSLHLLSGKLELPFIHLVTEHILMVSSLDLCYLLGWLHWNNNLDRPTNLKLKGEVWKSGKMKPVLEELNLMFRKRSSQKACWSECLWVMLLCVCVTPLRQCAQETKAELPPMFLKPSVMNIGSGVLSSLVLMLFLL